MATMPINTQNEAERETERAQKAQEAIDSVFANYDEALRRLAQTSEESK
jgi:hypothetical protein